MITISTVLGGVIILCVFIYTVSYGLWAWRNKNKMGGLAVLILAVLVILLPVYTLFIR